MFKKSAALILALILGSSTLGYAGATFAATGHDHGNAETAQKLQLDAGKRWATDAPLRKAMGTINENMRQALPAIHANTLAETQYVQLAEDVRAQVDYMFKNCKLSAEADTQLHQIIVQLLAAADKMAGAPTVRRDGAISVLAALKSYVRYFADDDFTPIAH